MRIAVILYLLFGLPSLAQTAKKAFWENGNQFLRYCDERSSFRLAESASSNQAFDSVCTVWLVGVRQGMQIEDESRSRRITTKAEEDNNRKLVDDLTKLGVKGVSIPEANACIPDDVTNEQIRLVVVKYMKDNPGQLTDHSALLAIAAIKNEWPCHD